MTAQILLYTHIAAGTLALIIGALAAMAKKGGNLHVLAGKVFVVSMAITATTAVLLSIIRPNPFMLGIGLFTGYLVASGWTWARRIKISLRTQYAKMMAFPGIGAAVYMLSQSWNEGRVNMVLVVFGVILLAMAIPDAFRRKTPESPIRLHAGRIGGAYIAAFTAFLVVNIEWGLVVWLGPTVVGTPLITFSLRQYAKRKNAGRKSVRTV